MLHSEDNKHTTYTCSSMNVTKPNTEQEMSDKMHILLLSLYKSKKQAKLGQ